MRTPLPRLLWALVRNVAARATGQLGPLDRIEIGRIRRYFAACVARGYRTAWLAGPFEGSRGTGNQFTGDLIVSLPRRSGNPERDFTLIDETATIAFLSGGHLDV